MAFQRISYVENQKESNIWDNLYVYPILHVNTCIGKFTLKVWTQPSIVKIAKNHEMDIGIQKWLKLYTRMNPAKNVCTWNCWN